MRFLLSQKKGYGKRTVATEYPTKGRGGKGMQTAKITEKNGLLAGLMTVQGDEDLMIITDTGVMIRTNLANISQTGRATMGVKVMRLDQDAQIVTFTTVAVAEKKKKLGQKTKQKVKHNVSKKKIIKKKNKRKNLLTNILAGFLILLSLALIFNTQIRNIFIVWNTNKYQVSQVSKEKIRRKSGYRRQF